MKHIQAVAEYRERKRVRRIQERLNHFGAKLLLSGLFDRPTRDALGSFQRRSGLPVTRRLNRQTLDLLFRQVKRETVTA
ncbi:MAG: peptidoglycan-binding protein [Bdellovibrionales bacterium]|nr:peptidoglycan-binding protein [Bdellovibrionales bacterium]